jgi:hypothetical protein
LLAGCQRIRNGPKGCCANKRMAPAIKQVGVSPAFAPMVEDLRGLVWVVR